MTKRCWVIKETSKIFRMPVFSEKYKMRPRHNWYSKIIRKYQKIRTKKLLPKNPIPDCEISAIAEKGGKLIIQITNGGLGDHLLYSSLPELLWKQKRIKTFISNYSIFRSAVSRDFIWAENPFIKFTDEKGWFIHRPLEHNFLTLDGYIQNLFGLEGNSCPKVYYKPQKIKELIGKTIVDPSFGPSGKANGYYELDFHLKCSEYLKQNEKNFVLIRHTHSKVVNPLENHLLNTFNPKTYEVKSIEELSDVLFSVKRKYLLHTGTASLNAALGLEGYVFNYYKPSTYKHFLYKCNNHIHLLKD